MPSKNNATKPAIENPRLKAEAPSMVFQPGMPANCIPSCRGNFPYPEPTSIAVLNTIAVLWNCVHLTLRTYTRNRLSVAGNFQAPSSVRRDTFSNCATCVGRSPCSSSLRAWATFRAFRSRAIRSRSDRPRRSSFRTISTSPPCSDTKRRYQCPAYRAAP